MLGHDTTIILDNSTSVQIKGTTERDQLMTTNEWRNYIVAYKRFADRPDPPPYDGPEPTELMPADYPLGLIGAQLPASSTGMSAR